MPHVINNKCCSIKCDLISKTCNYKVSVLSEHFALVSDLDWAAMPLIYFRPF